MYADVIVLSYQPPEIDFYTYEIPQSLEENLKVGQLVQVPFGTRNPLGLVVKIKNQKPEGIRTRPILSIYFPTPLLLPYQIELIKWMAFYYHAPVVNCLETMLPEISRKQLTVHSSQLIEKSVNREPSTVNQTIVLVPSINRIPETMAQFPQAKNHVIYHNQMKTSEIFAAWLKILNCDADYIFGSRIAIFTPCPNIEKIIIFDEHDRAYKDERSPYFDTLTVAEKIQSLTDAKLKIYDSSPKTTTYFNHQKEIVLEAKNRILPKVKIVSMIEEKNKGNKSPISDYLSDAITSTYKKGGKSLLFLNKKIESGQIYCNACAHQTFTKSAPQLCPNCKSSDIFYYSLNISSLSNLVRLLIPNIAIKLIAEGIDSTIANAPVQIATSSIFYAQNVEKFDLVCHIAVDYVANIPDFNSYEKVYAQITDLKKLTKKNGMLILQTHNPQSNLVLTTAESDFGNFYQKHLKDRKILSYPPYSLLVKLTIKGKNLQKISQQAQSLVDQLKKTGLAKNEKVFFLGPYQPIFGGKTPKYNIIIKKPITNYSLAQRQKEISDLYAYFDKITRDFTIIVEPLSLN